MKTSLLFGLTWLLAYVAAYGTYGAWERVLYYNVYLAELDKVGSHDNSGRKIAKSCVPDADFTKTDGTKTRACSFANFLKYIEKTYNPTLDPKDAAFAEATAIKNNLWGQARAFTPTEQDNLAFSLQKFQQTGIYVEGKIHTDLNSVSSDTNKIATLYEKMAMTIVDRVGNIEPYSSQSHNAFRWVGGLREMYFHSLMLPELREKVSSLGFPAKTYVAFNYVDLPADSRDGGKVHKFEKFDGESTQKMMLANNLFDAKTTKAKLKEFAKWMVAYKEDARSAGHFENQKAGNQGAKSIETGNTYHC